MPELPEVETLRRSLEDKIIGKEITGFKVIRTPGKRPRTLQGVSGEEFRNAVIGASFKGLARRGKYLIASLTTGETAVFHLMLSGWLDYFDSKSEITDRARRFAKLEFDFVDDSTLLFTDARNMGKVFLVSDEDFSGLGVLSRMGVEPLSPDFNLSRFKDVVSRSPGKTIKDFLTDQAKVAGIGNIYSDEIMRRAGIRPDRRVGSLTEKEVERLYRVIPETLEDAIDEIKSGGRGNMLAWRRKGRTCPDCGGEVVAVKHGASHYYWCPGCQK